MKDERGRRSTETGTVDLGIAGLRVPVHSHLASIWETEQDFSESAGFLVAGLRGEDHGVLIGDDADNERILALLGEGGVAVERVVAEGRLVVIAREPAAEAMLGGVTAALEAAVAAGAPLVRLFGNVGWGEKTGLSDAELFRYEAQLTEVAGRFPCVILCLHPVDALTGLIAWRGVLGTHVWILDEGKVVKNPFVVPPERFVQRVDAIAAELSQRQGEGESRRRGMEILQAIFDNIPVMISFRDSAGNLLLANQEWERVLGWTLAEAQRVDILAEIFPDAEARREVVDGLQRADRQWTDFRARTRDGRTVHTSGARVALSDGTRLGFSLDITERRDTEERLRQSAEELRALSERLQVVRERERSQMARNIHDEVGQALTALRMDVAWLETSWKGAGHQRASVESKLRSMSELIDTTLDAVQRIATELRPGVLDELGLEAAIEWYVREFEKRTGIACRFRSELEEPPPDAGRSTTVFRILQEALTNVARHSVATRARIDLSSDVEQLRLEVQDNGRGIAEDRIESSGSLGLVGMRERARALGGDLKIRGATGRGTTVTLTIPR